MLHFFSKKRIVIIIVIIILVGGGYLLFGRKKTAEQNYAIVRRGDLQQEVSVTGHVKPAKSADLAFERGGKVARVYVKIGDNVRAGQILVSLENSDISAQLLQAEAGLEAAKARLGELQKGTRPEEISRYRTALQSAKDQAVADLQNDYDSALTAMSSAASIAKNSLMVLTDIQFAHYSGTDQDSNNVADAKAAAVSELLGVAGAGRSASSLISSFSGGAFGLVQTAVLNPTHNNIDITLDKLLSAMQKVRDALYIIPITNDFTLTEKTNLNTEKTNINAQISTVSGKAQAIAVQKAANDSAIAAAEQTLNLALAGSTPEQIAAQEATVKSAEANVANYSAQLAKTIIYSPITGVVTKQEAKVGEIMAAGMTVVSVISEKQFEIEAYIS
jgi:multidrug efflux pump subunit AcrA (membrane-fusion protein)